MWQDAFEILKYFSCTVADVLPMCHKSEWEQRMEHQAWRTNLDTDKTHTKQSCWKYRPQDLAVCFPRLYYIHQEEIRKMCVKAFPDSLSGIVSWQHMYESVFCVHLIWRKYLSGRETVLAVCGWRVLCGRGQGFPHNTVCYHYLASPFFLCQLYITFQSRQREEQKESMRRKLKKRLRNRWGSVTNEDLK